MKFIVYFLLGFFGKAISDHFPQSSFLIGGISGAIAATIAILHK